MPAIAELATAMMSAAQRRMLVTATNLSNIATPSFHARRVFSQVMDLRTAMPVDFVAPVRSGAAGALKFTGNAFDIAAQGSAALLLRDGDGFVAVNSVQLQRDGEGRLAYATGRVLQAAGGGDLAIGPGVPTMLADGTILVEGQAVGRVGLFDARTQDGGALDGPPDAAADGEVRQGYLVPANVETGAEMIELTKAGRLAETGAKVLQIHDELLGRVVSKLGELGR